MTTTNANPVSPVLTGSTGLDLGPCDLCVRVARKSYDDVTALSDVTLDVPRGSVVGLIGRNGAGKTTLMKAILGATLLDRGTIELFGQDVAALSRTALAQLREHVAYVSATIAYPTGMRTTNVATMYQLAYPRLDLREFERLCSATGRDAPRRKV
ncbi:MAG: ATP-binding cassette domain-containing protein, partial [Atopobiaceae bacterium]|nr:ATP-binding cassette domain-containing protein [Atopobiaceae bacterium]